MTIPFRFAKICPYTLCLPTGSPNHSLRYSWSAREKRCFRASYFASPSRIGPGQPRGSFIGDACAALKSGHRLHMTKGEQTRDFLFVDDAADALIRAAERISVCRGEIINACTGVAITLAEAVQVIGESAGNPNFADLGAIPYRPQELMQYVGDPGKMARLLGWQTRISFAEGIRQTLAQP